jgi:hypothetical protein
MEDPRECILHKVNSHKGFRIDRDYTEHIRDSLLDAMFYTLADYVRHERETDELGIGSLERRHSFPRAFLECEDPYEWLEANRPKDDRSLIMFVHDHIPEMKQGKHRRVLLYIVNIIHFGL